MALTERNLKLSQKRSQSPQSSSFAHSPQQGHLSPPTSQSFNLETASDTGSARPSEGRRSTLHLKRGTETENVKVICRVRPFNKREFEIHAEQNAGAEHEWDRVQLRSVIQMDGQQTIFLDHEKGFAERERFHFDSSLWSIPPDQQESPNGFAAQETVMGIVGEPTLQHIWNGYNTTVFAYGQTGSGKTYSMMGTDDEVGLIPRICRQMFELLEARRQQDQEHPEEGQVREYRLEARFLEIYNERVRDLLWGIRPAEQSVEGLDHLNLKVRNVPNQGPQVMGITCIMVDSSDDCLRLIAEGTKNRSVAATKMNAESSRSHSIFRLTLTQTTKILPTKQFEKPKSFDRTSVISLVDLAGSERNKKTGAEGQRLKEAVAINQSLTSLKNVIDALVEGRSVIPFRDSQLTWLLSESLGGNSKTFMIACVSPHSDNAEETLNTLRYAARAQKIVTHAQVNESEEMLRMNRMRDELDRLQRQMNENPNEQMLDEEYHEQLRRLEELRDEALRKQQEEEHLLKAASRHDDMRYTQTYHHAFRTVLYKRLDKKYHDHNLLVRQRIDTRSSELARMRETKSEVDAELAEVTDEEKKATDALAAAELKLKLLQQTCEALDVQKADLVAKEDRLKDAQERKTALVKVAKHLGKVLVAHRRYVHDRQVERLNADKAKELKALNDAQNDWNAQAEEVHNERVQALRQEGARLRALIEATQKKHAKVSKQKSEKITSLHAACIFYENETKRCAPDLEKGLATINKTCSTRYYADKEAFAKRANDLLIELEQRNAKVSEDYQNRNSAAELEGLQQVENAEQAGRDTCDSSVRSYERQLEEMTTLWERRLKLLDALNVDTEYFLKETRHAEPRYAKLYDAAVAALNPPADSDTTVKDMAQKLRNAKGTLTSIVPQPFKFSSVKASSTTQTSCDPPPSYGQAETPRRERTAASDGASQTPQTPTTPRSAVETKVISGLVSRSRASTPNRTRSVQNGSESRTPPPPLPFSTRRTDLSRPASLAQPKRLVPSTTKTSRLREEILPKAQDARNGRPSSPARANGLSNGGPAAQPSSNRSMTPRTARETIAYLLSDEPHRIVVGETYILSRSRSPVARVYHSTPAAAPKAAQPGGNRSTPSRATTPARGATTPRR